MMWPLNGEGKGLDVAARWAALTGFVIDAARDGLPAQELERGLWRYLLQRYELQGPISPGPVMATAARR